MADNSTLFKGSTKPLLRPEESLEEQCSTLEREQLALNRELTYSFSTIDKRLRRLEKKLGL